MCGGGEEGLGLGGVVRTGWRFWWCWGCRCVWFWPLGLVSSWSCWSLFGVCLEFVWGLFGEVEGVPSFWSGSVGVEKDCLRWLRWRWWRCVWS